MVARLLWEQDVAGSNPVTPIFHLKNMEVFTIQEWEENFDELFKRVEDGETIGILREDGQAAVMMPADDELIRIYTDHEEAS